MFHNRSCILIPFIIIILFNISIFVTTFVLYFSKVYAALFCVELYLMRLAVTMFILGVGTSACDRAWAGKSNTMNAGVGGGGRPLTSPAPGSVGRRSTISYDQAKTSSSTERTNDAPRYSDIQLFLRTDTISILKRTVNFTCNKYKYDFTKVSFSDKNQTLNLIEDTLLKIHISCVITKIIIEHAIVLESHFSSAM